MPRQIHMGGERHPTLQNLAELSTALSESAFLAAHPEPVLVLHLASVEAPADPDTPTRGMPHVTREHAVDRRGRPRPVDGLVVPVRKSIQNAPSQMITVGRSIGNDVVVPSLGVSKLHGYFTSAAGVWRYRDAGSKNGSWYAGRKLERFEPVDLENRTELCLGPDVRAVWLDAAGLLELVRGLRAR